MARFSHAFAAFCLSVSATLAAGTESFTTLPESVIDFLDINCYECHNDTEKKGGLDIEALGFDPADSASMRMWTLLHDRVRDGEMPPKDELQPEFQERTDFLQGFEASLHNASEHQQTTKGRVRSRRLNRIEFENTLHDLLGINIPLKGYLPEDSEHEGFENIAEAQQVSYHLLQKYQEASDVALDEAFEPRVYGIDEISAGPRGEGPRRRGNSRVPFTIGDAAVAYPTKLAYHGRMPNTIREESGWYRIRLRARSVNAPEGHGVWTSVKSGFCYAVQPLMYWIGSFEARDEPEEHEFEAWIQEDHMLEIRPADRTLPQLYWRKIPDRTAPEEQGPGVAIEYLEVTPIYKGLNPTELRERLFGSLAYREGDLVSATPERELKKRISAFAERAYRRPVQESEIETYLAFANQVYRDEESLMEGLKAGYRAILASPRFLYFKETPGRLDPYSVASRLSYFLWNRGPDEPLLAAASNGSLTRPSEMHKQVERMLADERSQAFIENFAAQWLDLKDIDFTTPDETLYPEYDETLKHAMIGETHSFLRKLLDDNLSVANVIDSNFAMLNERIARHYGIDGVSGTEYRRVPIDAHSYRGGLITQASVLKVSANGTTTSPVIRGVWLLERVLGERIPQYELAYRMQTSVPELAGLDSEPEHILKMYGLDNDGQGGAFSKNCLLARRLIERGVRFVQVFNKGWDHHANIYGALPRQARAVDQACAGLITDLKQCGLLDETLIIWGGEFGRTPMVQEHNAGTGEMTPPGRDHHKECFSIWMAGGGVKKVSLTEVRTNSGSA